MALLLVGGPTFAQESGALSRAEVVARARVHSGGPAQRRAASETAATLRRRLPLSSPEVSFEMEAVPQPFSRREYAHRLRLEQELDFRGQRGARQRLGLAGASVVEREAEIRDQEIVSAADAAVGRWLVARRRTALLEPIRDRARALRDKAEVAQEKEIMTGFDSRLLQAEALGRESEWLEARRDLEAAGAELRIWTGLPESDAVALRDDLDAPPWRCSADTVLALARQYRSDLARAAAAESLAVARLRLEERLARPNPRVAFSVGRERLEIDDPALAGTVADVDRFVGLEFTLPLPIFSPDRSGIAEAAAELARVRVERTLLERETLREVAAACAVLKSGEERKRVLDQAAASAERDLLLVEQAYRGGRIPVDQHLTLSDRLIRLKLAAVEATAAVEAARTAIVSVTGLPREELQRRLEAVR